LTLFNIIAEGIEILEFVETLLQQNQGFAVPGLGVNGLLVKDLTDLAMHLVGANVIPRNIGLGRLPVSVGTKRKNAVGEVEGGET